MSDEELVSTKSSMLETLAELNDLKLNAIEQWISSQAYKKALEKKREQLKSDKILAKIGDAVKKLVPFGAEMCTEKIVVPTVGDQADCNKVNTCHIDEFLYDQDQVEELVKKGKLKRYYCLDCKSWNTKELIYTSHSMSKQALQYIFKVLLPSDLHNKQLLDVGSRLGGVLFGAYYLSNVSTIIGVEMNKECCEVQEKIIDKFSMDNGRIKVIHSDVLEQSTIISQSDIIVINVLDFFVDIDKHKEMWHFFKKHMKKGSYLVCNRSMAETLESLDIFEELIDWLNICEPNQIDNEILFDLEENSELFLYTIK